MSKLDIFAMSLGFSQFLYPTLAVNYVFPFSTTQVTGKCWLRPLYLCVQDDTSLEFVKSST